MHILGTSVLGRLDSFTRRHPNDRLRRYPPLDPALGKDGCPCFADLHYHDLRPGEPPKGQLDGGEGNEGGQGFGKVLEVFGKPPGSAEPGEGALDHPAARQDDEALRRCA